MNSIIGKTAVYQTRDNPPVKVTINDVALVRDKRGEQTWEILALREDGTLFADHVAFFRVEK